MIKRFSALFLFCAALFAQSAPPTPGTASAANTYAAKFNAAYYASKPPIYQQLYNARTGAQNANLPQLTQDAWTAAVNGILAAGGIVDEQIDFFPGADPYTEMFDRELAGDTWVPAGLGGVQCVNIAQYGCVVVPTTGPVPPGAIKVSTQLADFPPYPVPVVAPVVITTTQAANPIGVDIIPLGAASGIGDVFRCAVPSDGYALGATWTGTAQGFTGTWTKQALEDGLMTVWTKTT